MAQRNAKYAWGKGEKAKCMKLIPKNDRIGYMAYAAELKKIGSPNLWKRDKKGRKGVVAVDEWLELTGAERQIYVIRANGWGYGGGDGGGQDNNGQDPANAHDGNYEGAEGDDEPDEADAGDVPDDTGEEPAQHGIGKGKQPARNPPVEEYPPVQETPSPVIIVRSPSPERLYSPTEERLDLEDAHSADKRQRLNFTGTWRFVKVLYNRNTAGPVETWNSLYVGFNEDGIAEDRVVIKNTEIVTAFMGNPIPYMDGARPIMATIERYGGFQDSNFIVRQRAWGTYRRPDRFGIRAYTEFCPHGDLDLAITINGKRADADEDVQVPEPFIWLVIRNISEAIYYLQLGYFFDEKDSPDRPPPRDVPLIHLDIKPGNIFLDTPISPYLLYPNPKLADFDDHIEANPEALQTIEFWGTKSWQPPEQRNEDGPGLWTRTDIYSLGLVVVSLMRTKLIGIQDALVRLRLRLSTSEDYYASLEEYDKNVGDPSTEVYSRNLHEVVRRCLMVGPEDRPSAEELVEESRAMLSKRLPKGVTGPFEGLTTSTAPPHLELHFSAEKYPVGRRYQFPVDDDDDDDYEGEDGDEAI